MTAQEETKRGGFFFFCLKKSDWADDKNRGMCNHGMG